MGRPDLLVHPCQQWVPEQRWSNQRNNSTWGGDEESASFDPMTSRTKHLSDTSHAITLLAERSMRRFNGNGNGSSVQSVQSVQGVQSVQSVPRLNVAEFVPRSPQKIQKPMKNYPTPSRSPPSITSNELNIRSTKRSFEFIEYNHHEQYCNVTFLERKNSSNCCR